MNSEVGRPQIGQWYLRSDKGEIFLVTGTDSHARTIGIQTFDGDLDEFDEETWSTLPLALTEPPEDWTGPVDDVEVDDLGYSETEMTGKDWAAPLQPFAAPEEAWENTTDIVDGAPEVEGLPKEDFVADNNVARDLSGEGSVS